MLPHKDYANSLDLESKATDESLAILRPSPGKVARSNSFENDPRLTSSVVLKSGVGDRLPEPVVADRIRGSFAVVATPEGYALVGRVQDLTRPADMMATLLAWLRADTVASNANTSPDTPLISRYFASVLDQAIARADQPNSTPTYWTWALKTKTVNDTLKSIYGEVYTPGAGPARNQDNLETGYFRYSYDYRAHDPVHSQLQMAMGTADTVPSWLSEWSRPTENDWHRTPDWAARQDAELLHRLGRSWWLGSAQLIDEILAQPDDRLLAIAGSYRELYGQSVDAAITWLAAAPNALGSSYQRRFNQCAQRGTEKLETVRMTGDRTRLLRWARDVTERRRRVQGYAFLRESPAPGRDGSSTADARVILWIFGHSSPEKPPSTQMVDYLTRIVTDARDGGGGHLVAIISALQDAAVSLCPDDSGAVQLSEQDISNTFVAWSELIQHPYRRGETGNYLIFACHSAGIPVRYDMRFNQPRGISPFELEAVGENTRGGVGHYKVRLRSGFSLDSIFQRNQLADDDWITINWYIEGPRSQDRQSSRFVEPPATKGGRWRDFQTWIATDTFSPADNACDLAFRYADKGTHRVTAMLTWPDIDAPNRLWGNVAFVSREIESLDDKLADKLLDTEPLQVGQLLAKLEHRRANALAQDTAAAYFDMAELRTADWDPKGTSVQSLSKEFAASSAPGPVPQQDPKYRTGWASHSLYCDVGGTIYMNGSWYVCTQDGEVEGALPIKAGATDLQGIDPNTTVYQITRTAPSLTGLSYLDDGLLRFQTMFPGDYVVLCQPHNSDASAAMHPIRIFDPESERVAEDRQLASHIDFILDQYQDGDLVYLEGKATKLFPVTAVYAESHTTTGAAPRPARQVHLYLGCTNERSWRDHGIEGSYGTPARSFRDGTGWLLFDFTPGQPGKQSVYGNRNDSIDECFSKFTRQSSYPVGRVYADWNASQVNALAPRSHPYIVNTRGAPVDEAAQGWLGLSGLAFMGLALSGIGAPLVCIAIAAGAGTIASISSIRRNIRNNEFDLQTFTMDAAGLAATFIGIGGIALMKHLKRTQSLKQLGGNFKALPITQIATNLAHTDLVLSSLEFLLLSDVCVDEIATILRDDQLDSNIKLWRLTRVIANLALAGALYGYGAKDNLDPSRLPTPNLPPVRGRGLGAFDLPPEYSARTFLAFLEKRAPGYHRQAMVIAARDTDQLEDLYHELIDLWVLRNIELDSQGHPVDVDEVRLLMGHFRKYVEVSFSDPTHRFRNAPHYHVPLDNQNLRRGQAYGPAGQDMLTQLAADGITKAKIDASPSLKEYRHVAHYKTATGEEFVIKYARRDGPEDVRHVAELAAYVLSQELRFGSVPAAALMEVDGYRCIVAKYIPGDDAKTHGGMPDSFRIFDYLLGNMDRRDSYNPSPYGSMNVRWQQQTPWLIDNELGFQDTKNEHTDRVISAWMRKAGRRQQFDDPFQSWYFRNANHVEKSVTDAIDTKPEFVAELRRTMPATRADYDNGVRTARLDELKAQLEPLLGPARWNQLEARLVTIWEAVGDPAAGW